MMDPESQDCGKAKRSGVEYHFHHFPSEKKTTISVCTDAPQKLTIRVSWGDDTGRVNFFLPGMGAGTASAGDEQVFWRSGRRRLRMEKGVIRHPHFPPPPYCTLPEMPRASVFLKTQSSVPGLCLHPQVALTAPSALESSLLPSSSPLCDMILSNLKCEMCLIRPQPL